MCQCTHTLNERKGTGMQLNLQDHASSPVIPVLSRVTCIWIIINNRSSRFARKYHCCSSTTAAMQVFSFVVRVVELCYCGTGHTRTVLHTLHSNRRLVVGHRQANVQLCAYRPVMELLRKLSLKTCRFLLSIKER